MLRDTLKTLLEAYGGSGSEHGVAEAIRTLLEGHVDSMKTDVMGNLIVEKYGTDDNAKRIMIAAHMDHIGLIVTHIEDDGFLRVTNVGGVSVDMSRGRHVVFANGVNGVCWVEPKENGAPTMANLFIDIGAATAEEAAAMVSLGDVAVYAPNVFNVGKHRVAAPAMDDRCACALLVDPENDPTVLFTTAGMHPLVPYLLWAQKHPEGQAPGQRAKMRPHRRHRRRCCGRRVPLHLLRNAGQLVCWGLFQKEAIAWSWEFLTSRMAGAGS
jgi:hypothetical protein